MARDRTGDELGYTWWQRAVNFVVGRLVGLLERITGRTWWGKP